MQARLLFNSAVQPSITYSAAAWHSPESQRGNPVIQTISKIQVGGLCTVAGIYQATLTRELEKRTFTPQSISFVMTSGRGTSAIPTIP
jgi:hypothetical protein